MDPINKVKAEIHQTRNFIGQARHELKTLRRFD